MKPEPEYADLYGDAKAPTRPPTLNDNGPTVGNGGAEVDKVALAERPQLYTTKSADSSRGARNANGDLEDQSRSPFREYPVTKPEPLAVLRSTTAIYAKVARNARGKQQKTSSKKQIAVDLKASMLQPSDTCHAHYDLDHYSGFGSRRPLSPSPGSYADALTPSLRVLRGLSIEETR
jgi:hypothetical protein